MKMFWSQIFYSEKNFLAQKGGKKNCNWMATYIWCEFNLWDRSPQRNTFISSHKTVKYCCIKSNDMINLAAEPKAKSSQVHNFLRRSPCILRGTLFISLWRSIKGNWTITDGNVKKLCSGGFFNGILASWVRFLVAHKDFMTFWFLNGKTSWRLTSERRQKPLWLLFRLSVGVRVEPSFLYWIRPRSYDIFFASLAYRFLPTFKRNYVN